MISRRDHTGFVLLAVLWVMAGVAALGVLLTLAARRGTVAATNRMNAIVAQWRAEDCASRARLTIDAALSMGSATDTAAAATAWQALDRIVSHAPVVAAAPCTVTLTAAGRTIDVNTADQEVLTRLVSTLGLAPERVDSLVDAILDWRDPDDVPRPSGAESAWYAARGLGTPRNGPFANVRELRRVRGLAGTGLDTLLGVESGRVLLDRAPLAVASALPGFGAEAVARIADYRVRGMPVPDLLGLSAHLSPGARATLVSRYPDLVRLTTTEPDAWILTAVGTAGSPTIRAVVELRLVHAGTRAAVVRRRTWLE